MASRRLRVGGGDDAHAGAARAVGAEALELAGLQHPQQLRLAAAAERAELVEEQRAAVGGLEAPGARARAGERAGLGAEQLRLDELVGQRAEVHLEVRALSRTAELACTMSASTSLPAPFGPVMSTGTSACATCVAIATSVCMASLS